MKNIFYDLNEHKVDVGHKTDFLRFSKNKGAN